VKSSTMTSIAVKVDKRGARWWTSDMSPYNGPVTLITTEGKSYKVSARLIRSFDSSWRGKLTGEAPWDWLVMMDEPVSLRIERTGSEGTGTLRDINLAYPQSATITGTGEFAF
jgi:hypothetical protein